LRERLFLVRSFALLGVPLAILLTGCGAGGGEKSVSRAREALPAVVVAEVKRQQVPLEIHAIGNVEAYSAVEVKSQVAGQLVHVSFEEGQDVRQG
jgi:multidrug efflux system membrane fusion protein